MSLVMPNDFNRGRFMYTLTPAPYLLDVLFRILPSCSESVPRSYASSDLSANVGLSHPSLRASLPLHPPTPRQPHRALSTSSFQNYKSKTTEVPVASYTQPTNTGAGGNAAAERTTLKVDGSQSAATTVASEDVGRKAVAFDRGLVAKMTPTMARFTLQGKVAVVTG